MSRQPILYSALYYRAGTDSHTRRYHLYRIDPDGSGRRQLTSGGSDDTQPTWSPDGERIAFRRSWNNEAHPESVCIMAADGGPARTVLVAERTPNTYLSVEWLTPTRLLITKSQYFSPPPYRSTSCVVDVSTGRTFRQVRKTWSHSISPGGEYMTAWSDGNGENAPTRIVRLADGKEVPLREALTGDSVWLDNRRFVYLAPPYEQPRLMTFFADGWRQSVLPIRLDPSGLAWLKQNDGADAYAYFLNRVPGRTDSLLVGWRLGGSRDGAQAATFLVDLKSGRAMPWAITNDIVPSPDNRYFLTTRAQEDAPIGIGGREGISPLLLGRTDAPQQQRPLVHGLVRIAGFDWRPSPKPQIPSQPVSRIPAT